MCTFQKAINNVGVKVDVQKGTLRFREIFDYKSVMINLHFHAILSYGNSAH